MVTQHHQKYGSKPQQYHAKRAKYALVPPKADRTQYLTLDPYLSAIRDQGETGACTAFSFTSAHEAAGRIIGATVTELSVLDEYYWARVAAGDCAAGSPCPDDGATLDHSVDTSIERGGNAPAAAWPFDHNPEEVPPAAAVTAPKLLWIDGFQPISAADFVDGIIAAINSKQPFLMAFQVYESWRADCDTTAVFSASPTGAILGGHQMNGACFIPPDPAKPDTMPGGLVGFDNSFGTKSPARPDIDPNPKAGRVYLHVETFSTSAVREVVALVPKMQPAILSLAITGPSTLPATEAAAFSATLTGAPEGTQVSYTWDFGDGAPNISTGDVPTASHVYGAAGNFTVQCAASVASTGAAAGAILSIAVSAPAAPSPSPSPSTNPQSAPATCQSEVATECASLVAQAQAARGTGTAWWYDALANAVTTWIEPSLEQAVGSRAASVGNKPIPLPAPPKGA